MCGLARSTAHTKSSLQTIGRHRTVYKVGHPLDTCAGSHAYLTCPTTSPKPPQSPFPHSVCATPAFLQARCYSECLAANAFLAGAPGMGSSTYVCQSNHPAHLKGRLEPRVHPYPPGRSAGPSPSLPQQLQWVTCTVDRLNSVQVLCCARPVVHICWPSMQPGDAGGQSI